MTPITGMTLGSVGMTPITGMTLKSSRDDLITGFLPPPQRRSGLISPVLALALVYSGSVADMWQADGMAAL